MSTHYLAVAACLFSMLSTPARAAADRPEVIRWVVAHDRGSTPFSELNRKFARDIEKKSGGTLKVEFLKNEASDSKIDEAAYKQVTDGDADMSQLGASAAGAPVFEMPFLFRNYDHAEAVFKSPVGKKLVAGVTAASGGKVRAFGFTYSGGYRILVGHTALHSLNDFKNVRMRRSTSYLSPFMEQLGATLVEAGPASRDRPISDIAAGKIDLEETEINKLALISEENPDLLKQFDYANLTYHRMYVTAIVANEKFFAKLSPAHQKLLAREMEDLAAAERKLSIDMAKANLKVLAKKGVRFVELPEGEHAALARAGETFRKTVPELAGVIAEVQAIKDPNKLALK